MTCIVAKSNYSLMIDENRLVYRYSADEVAEKNTSSKPVCKFRIHDRQTNTISNEIWLNHDHSFSGLCAVDMSTYGIITTDGPHYLWAPSHAKEEPPNLKIWKPKRSEYGKDGYVVEKPSSTLHLEHLLASRQYLMTGGELKVDTIWNFENTSKIHLSFDDLIKKHSRPGIKQDFRIRGRFLVIFLYDETEDKMPRQIHEALIFDIKSQVLVKKIDPCDSIERGDSYNDKCYWSSFRELTVVGDSMIYGQEVWIAHCVSKQREVLKVFPLDGESTKPVIRLKIPKSQAVTVCGPHILLRRRFRPDEDLEPFKDCIEGEANFGIRFVRLEYNGETWFWKECFVTYPRQAIEDLDFMSSASIKRCQYVDVEVVAETQVLFSWQVRNDNGDAMPKSVIRDYLVK